MLLSPRAHPPFRTRLLPGYWVLMTISAVRAMAQFVSDPFRWEKTVPGLSPAPTEPAGMAGTRR